MKINNYKRKYNNGYKSNFIKSFANYCNIVCFIVLIYGIIFVSIDFSNNINYESVMKMDQGKLIQILFSSSCIVMGIVLLTIVIIDYVFEAKYLKIYEGLIYPTSLSVCSAILLIGFVVITILIEEISLILLTILPTNCILIYGEYLIYKNRKNIIKTKNIQENIE